MKWDEVLEAAAYHEVSRVGEYGAVEPGHVALQIIETVSGGAPCGVEVYAREALHDVHVVGDLVFGHDGLAEALYLDVLGVILAYGNGRVDDVRDDHHAGLDLLGELGLLLFEGRELVGHLGHSGLDLLGLVFEPLLHVTADLLGEAVPGCAQLVAPGLGGADFLVELDDLVNERELFVLELLLDVFLYDVGIAPQEFDIYHFFSLYSLRHPV